MLRILRWLTVIVLLVVPARVMRGESVATLPAPTGYVSDFAGVLTPETKQALEDLCTQVDRQAHAQIAVVTVKSIDAEKSGAVPSIQEFSVALEEKWKVGKKGTDRGLLLVISLSPRKYWFEVGYGLEGLLNDAKVGDIGREMQSDLHTGDYNAGISLAVREIAQDIATDAGVTLSTDAAPVHQYHYENQPQDHYENQPQAQMSGIQALVIGGIIIVVVAVLIRTGHIGLLFYLLFSLMGGGGGGRGGGRDGDGGGGGFGGFGGGSSGGGGAGGDF